MIGYDMDGVVTRGIVPEANSVIISGRTFAEYDDMAKQAAQKLPVYIRGIGVYGDRQHAGNFKALMIALLGITKFYEDDPLQIDIIKLLNPNCEIVHVTDNPPDLGISVGDETKTKEHFG